MKLTWKPVVVGVDASPESAVAVTMGWRIAQMAGVKCHVVHALHDVRSSLVMGVSPMSAAEVQEVLVDAVAKQLVESLRPHVPDGALDAVEFRADGAASGLAQAVADHGAGLVVLGGRHHSTLGRWLGGSTAQNAARVLDVPLLVTGAAAGPIRRVLVAVDLSYAAPPTIAQARRYATLFGATQRAVHALEPISILPEVPPLVDERQVAALTHDRLEREVWPLLDPRVERAVLPGTAAEAIGRAAKDWGADLVVVGSHGKGWWDRLILGSVTERLLDALPASLLVVPVPGVPVPAVTPEPVLTSIA